jgi:Bacterial SH3 domain
VKKLELAAWCLVFTLLGAEVGLAVLRPWDRHVPLSLSGSQASSLVRASGSPSPGATTLVTPSTAGKCPDVVVHRIEQVHTIPRSAWIHASDGVNVRAAPSSSATRLTTLATGTQLTVQEERGNPDGIWYRIRLEDGRDGWLVGRYTTNYAISLASTDSLKIWLPIGYQFQPVGPGKAEARYKNGPVTLLYLESGAKSQAPAETTVPASLPRRSSWTARPTEQVLVGDLPATDRVFGVKLANGACPALLHEVRIATTSRYYDLIFLLDEPSSSVVAQLLDSATLQ